MFVINELRDRFSPRNGEVILKQVAEHSLKKWMGFQSPQWGSNSKENRGKRHRFSYNVSVPAMGK